MRTKTVHDAMTLLDDVFMLEISDIMGMKTMDRVNLTSGHVL